MNWTLAVLDFLVTAVCIYCAYRCGWNRGACHGIDAGFKKGLQTGVNTSFSVLTPITGHLSKALGEAILTIKKLQNEEDADNWWKKQGGKPPWMDKGVE